MSGMSQRRNLKEVETKFQVKAISLCRDTYSVTTADGEVAEFWEPNLRFITDSGDLGPAKGAPVILPAGMMGDRASVFFAAPEEISRLVQHRC
jgi:cytochrome c